MPILVKHSGNVAPTLVGAYGGGLGKRYAEQSDDAMRRIDSRQRRGGGVLVGQKFKGGGKSPRQEAAEAAGFVGVGDNPSLIGGGQLNQYGDPNTRVINLPNAGGSRTWRQPEEATAAQIAEQAVIDRERRAAEREQAIFERGQGVKERERIAAEKKAALEENPFVGMDASRLDATQKAQYDKLMTAWENARKNIAIPGAELEKLNRDTVMALKRISAMPSVPKPTIKVEGFGAETIEVPFNTIQKLPDGSMITVDSSGKINRDPPEKKTEDPVIKQQAVAEQKRSDRRAKMVADAIKEKSVNGMGEAVEPDMDEVEKYVLAQEEVLDRLEQRSRSSQQSAAGAIPQVFFSETGSRITDPNILDAGETVQDEAGNLWRRKRWGNDPNKADMEMISPAQNISPTKESASKKIAPEGTIVDVGGVKKIKRGGKWVNM